MELKPKLFVPSQRWYTEPNTRGPKGRTEDLRPGTIIVQETHDLQPQMELAIQDVYHKWNLSPETIISTNPKKSLLIYILC